MELSISSVERQIGFHHQLVFARKAWLLDALLSTSSTVDPVLLKSQLIECVPVESQRILAASGIRDEHVFAVPCMLETMPSLVGYYRLLLGIPQKSFYAGSTGMGQFKNMECKFLLTEKQRTMLPEFCKVVNTHLDYLVRHLTPSITMRDLSELPLLVLGSQFQGGNNNKIGKQATVDVFLAVSEVVKHYIESRNDRVIIVRNASKRKVVISLSTDPDIKIEEEFQGQLRKKVAIEIKGGTDKSNAHNRAGEAEKSHQKAKGAGFRDFWTISARKGLDTDKLRTESPTTTSWFEVAHILAHEGVDWIDFCARLAGEIGIPMSHEK